MASWRHASRERSGCKQSCISRHFTRRLCSDIWPVSGWCYLGSVHRMFAGIANGWTLFHFARNQDYASYGEVNFASFWLFRLQRKNIYWQISFVYLTEFTFSLPVNFIERLFTVFFPRAQRKRIPIRTWYPMNVLFTLHLHEVTRLSLLSSCHPDILHNTGSHVALPWLHSCRSKVLSVLVSGCRFMCILSVHTVHM